MRHSPSLNKKIKDFLEKGSLVLLCQRCWNGSTVSFLGQALDGCSDRVHSDSLPFWNPQGDNNKSNQNQTRISPQPQHSSVSLVFHLWFLPMFPALIRNDAGGKQLEDPTCPQSHPGAQAGLSPPCHIPEGQAGQGQHPLLIHPQIPPAHPTGRVPHILPSMARDTHPCPWDMDWEPLDPWVPQGLGDAISVSLLGSHPAHSRER